MAPYSDPHDSYICNGACHLREDQKTWNLVELPQPYIQGSAKSHINVGQTLLIVIHSVSLCRLYVKPSATRGERSPQNIRDYPQLQNVISRFT